MKSMYQKIKKQVLLSVVYFCLFCFVQSATAQQADLSGLLFDQDKTHLGSEPILGDSWTHNWYNDINGNGDYDPGEPWSDTEYSGWTYASDDSCWMATASNLVQYIGGSNSYYDWAYNGTYNQKTFENGGDAKDLVESLGYTTRSIGGSWAYWTGWNGNNPADWMLAEIQQGSPLRIGIGIVKSGLDGRHALTVYGIDTTNQTTTLADSDSDHTSNFRTCDYSWDGDNFRINFLAHSPDDIEDWEYMYNVTSVDMTGQNSNWLGSGTSGNSSMTGDTTEWSDPDNWSIGHTPIINDNTYVNFTGAGQVNIDCHAKADVLSLIDGANVSVANGYSLTVDDSLRVGMNGFANTLNITSGGTVSDTNGNIYKDSVVTVDGTGSDWANSDELYVGYGGSATLNIISGGTVGSSIGYINWGSEVAVDGVGSTWTNGNRLRVGEFGNGTLNITNGGAVSSSFANIGDYPGLTGKLTVDGIGSTWIGQYLIIGVEGDGTLNITNGGSVSNTHGFIASLFGSTGVVTVDGIGSTWTNGDGDDRFGSLEVGGYGGIGGTLNVTGGGLVSVSSDLTIDYNGSGNSFINMTDGGMLALYDSDWTSSDNLYDFLGLISGTGAINYWDGSAWTNITSATYGDDYTLEHITDGGDLDGYTILTVFTLDPDIDEDGDVDLQDYAVLAKNWKVTNCNELNNWCEKADIDKSGAVDFNDLLIMTEQWLANSATVQADFVANYNGSSPTIDGVLSGGEWGSSYTVTMDRVDGGGQHDIDLYFQNDGTYLFVGVNSQWESGWDVVWDICIDGDYSRTLNGNLSQPYTDIQVCQQSPSGYSGYRAYRTLTDTGEVRVGFGSGADCASSGSTNVSYEFRVPLADLDVIPEASVGFTITHGYDGISEHLYEFVSRATPEKWATLQIVP